MPLLRLQFWEFLKKCPTLSRATCGGWQERMVAITPQNFYVQVTFSTEDRLSIGCPVPKILTFEERPHGRPAAHTQDFPLIQYELARSLRSLARNNTFLHKASSEASLATEAVFNYELRKSCHVR